MAYEYRVTRDYVFEGEQLHEGDIVTDADFYEPDMPANLVGRGVLEPADMEAEKLRLKPDKQQKPKKAEVEEKRLADGEPELIDDDQ